jgi:YhcH/YjgK/YiaL family protein
MTGCNVEPDDPPAWDEQKLSAWFNRGGWKSEWNIQADDTINRREMARQFSLNPERWNKAFKFLKSQPIQQLPAGRIAIAGDDVYAVIDEYTTRDEEDSRFEAHRKYADIQYVLSGEERIGVVQLHDTEEAGSYDREKDIIFLKASENNYRTADPERFFVFFPKDAHRPCVKAVSNAKVRKIVIKVRLD